MSWQSTYSTWKTQDLKDGLQQELEAVSFSEAELFDRFYRDLEFGTGGLRGEIGVGTNRMNIYTVGKATQGMARYLLKTFADPSVCIGYDTRNKSELFAKTAASVFAGNGVKVHLFSCVHPVPMLSYSVRHQNASAGVMITASHNPKEYNGYKVYNEKGNQITDSAANEILSFIGETNPFSGVKKMDINEAEKAGLLFWMGEEVDAAYYEKVKALSMRQELIEKEAGSLKIIYTPLNGSGNIPVRRVLSEQGYSNLLVVKEQEAPDGNFPTTPYPNPEVPSVFDLAKEMAKTENPDLIFATDPDCDRIGVLVKDPNGAYLVMTGNQVGVLLAEYIISARKEKGTLPVNAGIVSTIVSTPMGKAVAKKHGVHYEETLTGFKYIGEKIDEWETSGAHTFLFGYEESYGYLSGDFVRDKDGVIAASLIAEMALYYKGRGMTLYDAIQSLYREYNFYLEELISVTMKGAEGQAKIGELVSQFRQNYQMMLAGEQVEIFEDYKTSTRVFIQSGTVEPIALPQSNVVKVVFHDGSWFVIRPSGTEPKVKVYMGAQGETEEAAKSRLEALQALAKRVVK